MISFSQATNIMVNGFAGELAVAVGWRTLVLLRA